MYLTPKELFVKYELMCAAVRQFESLAIENSARKRCITYLLLLSASASLTHMTMTKEFLITLLLLIANKIAHKKALQT